MDDADRLFVLTGGPGSGKTTLLGASLMVLADLVGRTAMAPTQLPVSLLTALIGGPFFVYLVRWRVKR